MLKQYAMYTLTRNQEMVLSNCRIPLVPGLCAPSVNLCSREAAWQECQIPWAPLESAVTPLTGAFGFLLERDSPSWH